MGWIGEGVCGNGQMGGGETKDRSSRECHLCNSPELAGIVDKAISVAFPQAVLGKCQRFAAAIVRPPTLSSFSISPSVFHICFTTTLPE